MPRVAGVDPGTVSFDLCVLQDGEPVLEQVFETGSLSQDSRPLLEALTRHAPYDLVYGPSGYGLPLLAAAEVGERELAEMVLVRPDEARAEAGIGGMRSLLRSLARTADKVCAAACAIADQSARLAISPHETAMVLLELGGGFTAALAIDQGQIVDGMGGSSGPLGVRAAGALDGELAYLLGPALGKNTLYSGGALDPSGELAITDLEALWSSPEHAEGWTALLEAAVKAVRALTVSVPAPKEIVVSGRLARLSGLLTALTSSLHDIAPVTALRPGRASTAAHGGALLADALTGGPHAALADALRLRESRGSALDYLRVAGAESISLG
jgi:predicted butyrate kinase (DUF1464 family)